MRLDTYQVIYRFLQDNYSDNNELKKFWGYLTNNVVFIQISTDVSSALKIFETINERGVGLNPMDLLKNLLFTQVHSNDFSKLKDEWKKVTGPLEKQGEKPLRFLRYFLMANYKIKVDRKNANDSSNAIVREDEIYDWFVSKDNATLCDYQNKPFEFVRKLIRNVELYIHFSNGQANDGQVSIAMQNLKLLTGGAFSLHYVLLLAAGNFPRNLFDHFVEQTESFLSYYIFTKTPTKDLERNFSVWADELREIGALNDIELKKQKLNDFVANRFQKDMDSKEGELTDALNRYSLQSMQKYRTHYLLAKLTQFVDSAYTGTKGTGALSVYRGIEIEHILPNTPSNALKDDFKINNPEKDYSTYKNKLGNLMLLEKPLNIISSNNFYDLKKEEYLKSSYYLTRSIVQLVYAGNNSSINRINPSLEEFQTWDASTIDKRQEILIKLIKQVWKTNPLI